MSGKQKFFLTTKVSQSSKKDFCLILAPTKRRTLEPWRKMPKTISEIKQPGDRKVNCKKTHFTQAVIIYERTSVTQPNGMKIDEQEDCE